MQSIRGGLDKWKKSSAAAFWGEISPCDHVLQIYETDEAFINTLAGFVGAGINSGECSIVIATQPHLQQLEGKLASCGLQVESLIEEQRYMPLDAEEVLSMFMVNNWPDSVLFRKTITAVIEKARRGNRGIRAFGEMVALLWAQGHCGATVQLEILWNEIVALQPFPLFCAYPKTGFTQGLDESVNEICCNHAKMVSNPEHSMHEILFAHSLPSQVLESRRA
jgi:hypothetical protein